MLASMGVAVERRATTLVVNGPVVPRAVDVTVCGDASSAAFFAVAAAIVGGSDVTVEDVCLNPTRTGFVEVLRRMGAHIDTAVAGQTAREPVGSLRVRGGETLHGDEIGPDEVPATIDELPVLAVAAALARGTTVMRGIDGLDTTDSNWNVPAALHQKFEFFCPGIHTNLLQAYESLKRIKETAHHIIPIHEVRFTFVESIP